MEIIYSKLEPNKILHIVYRVNEFYDVQKGHRKDIIEDKEFIQLSALKMKKGQTFQPHQHIWFISHAEVAGSSPARSILG